VDEELRPELIEIILSYSSTWGLYTKCEQCDVVDDKILAALDLQNWIVSGFIMPAQEIWPGEIWKFAFQYGTQGNDYDAIVGFVDAKFRAFDQTEYGYNSIANSDRGVNIG